MMRIAMITTDSRDHFQQYDGSVPYFGTAPQALLEGLSGRDDIEVHVISCLHQPMVSPEKLASNIYYHGLPVGRLAWLKSGYLGCIRAVRKCLSEIRPDLVHGQGTERDCAMAAVFSGYPNVLTIHGNMAEIARLGQHGFFSFYGLASKLERICLKKTDGVVCITNYTQELVKSYAEKTWVLPNAVDSRYFEVDSKIDSKKPPVILMVGAITSRKNQNFLIRSLEPLSGELEFEVRFLGSVSEGSAYSAEFLDLVNARSWCSHVGFVDRDELKDQLAASTLLILPSLEDNCPMVILEAMAARVPVIASRVGGIPDLLAEGRTGLFVNPLNGDSILKAVKNALEETEQIRSMAIIAKEEALQRFHPRIIAQKHVEIYKAILQEKK